jgi:hypothetical protein
MRRIWSDGLELGESGTEVVRAVFVIDQEPVKAGCGAEFGGVRIGEGEPAADERSALLV